jgi:hypothetical protein
MSEDATRVPCPSCARCGLCGGTSSPGDEVACEACDTCMLCFGSRLVTREVRDDFLAVIKMRGMT